MANESENIMEILKEHEERIEALESILKGKDAAPEITSIDAKIKNFCSEININEDQLKSVFDISEKNVTLITEISGKEIEKQFKATVCILTAYRYLFDRDVIKSCDLRKKLEWLGIKSLGNLSTNLAKYKRCIIPKGETGSHNFSYKITYPGLKEGLKIIISLASE